MRKKLGELLVESGGVSPAAVQAALQQQAGGDRRRLGELLVAAGVVRPLQVAGALGAQHGLTLTRLGEVDAKAAALVPLDYQREHRLLFFAFEPGGAGVQVAVEDPASLELVDELRFQMQRDVQALIACRADLDAAYARLRGESAAPAPEPVLAEDDDSVPVVGGELVSGELSVGDTPTLELPSEWAEEEPAAAPAVAAPVVAAPTVAAPVQPRPPQPAPAAVAPARPAPAAGPVAAGVAVGVALAPPVLHSSAAPARQTPVPLPTPAPVPARPPPPPAASSQPPPAAPPRAATPVPPPGAAPARAPSVPAPGAAAAPPAGARPRLDFSEEDLRILDAIDRLAAGSDEVSEAEKVRPARMVASLVRLLMRKGVIHELEFLEELSRK